MHVTTLYLKSKANRNGDVKWLVDLKAGVSAETLGAEWVSHGQRHPSGKQCWPPSCGRDNMWNVKRCFRTWGISRDTRTKVKIAKKKFRTPILATECIVTAQGVEADSAATAVHK